MIVLGVLGAPAVALRALCMGHACDADETEETAIPFCALPPETRTLIAAGFREGRSPDVLAVTASTPRVTSHDEPTVVWPWVDPDARELEVPVAFVGPGIRTGDAPSASLADLAPTLEPLLGIRRPHPEVRSGHAIAGVVRPGAASPLVVTIVWKRLGHLGAAADAFDEVLGSRDDAAIGSATIGGVPLDPAAVLTTISSGGTPAEHGITGTRLRTDDGEVVRAWSGGAPTSVIATLGDDLDEITRGDATIGLVADAPSDRGLIGGTWYPGDDDDEVVVERRDPVGAVAGMLDEGLGAGDAPDLLGVTIGARPRFAAAITDELLDLVLARVPDATIVVTGTGAASAERTVDVSEVAGAVETALAAPVVAEVGAAGLYLDPDVAAARGISSQQVAEALLELTDAGAPLFVDAFPAFAVQFGRYC
jgi:hypothetical protein